MQLNSANFKGWGVTNAFNPTQNLHAGIAYLNQMLNEFKNVPLALAAYGAGPGQVQAAGDKVAPWMASGTTGWVDPMLTILKEISTAIKDQTRLLQTQGARSLQVGVEPSPKKHLLPKRGG